KRVVWRNQVAGLRIGNRQTVAVQLASDALSLRRAMMGCGSDTAWCPNQFRRYWLRVCIALTSGAQCFSADGPFSACNLVDADPSDAAHGLAFDFHHRIRDLVDHRLLL